jgi:glycosyltransferase involved in cell wall biosynthesis
MEVPAVSVVVPTRNRADYLAVAVRSLADQEGDTPYELLVVDDGSSDSTGAVARAAGARVIRLDPGRGLNAARNAGIAATTGALVAFVDDDVWAPPGWLRAFAEGAERHTGAEAFAGPIRARLEGPAPRSCGREAAPITTLDLGDADTDTDRAWGANFAVRRSAVQRIGGFDEDLPIYGDEEEWMARLRRADGRIEYLAAAGLDHRRAGDDARLRSLARSEYRRGRASRVNDRRKGHEPGMPRELRNLAGAGWHTLRHACPQGLIMGAHAAGRLAEALRPR